MYLTTCQLFDVLHCPLRWHFFRIPLSEIKSGISQSNASEAFFRNTCRYTAKKNANIGPVYNLTPPSRKSRPVADFGWPSLNVE